VVYRPCLRSFANEQFYSLSPAALAGAALYFFAGPDSWWLWLLSSGLFLFSAFLCAQDVMVHLTRLTLDEKGARVRGPFERGEILWSDVVGALLRERRNVVTSNDHLLILESQLHQLVYNTSTLSRRDEQAVLALVRRRIPLVVENEQPSS
jgi:hypothetical protein